MDEFLFVHTTAISPLAARTQQLDMFVVRRARLGFRIARLKAVLQALSPSLVQLAPLDWAGGAYKLLEGELLALRVRVSGAYAAAYRNGARCGRGHLPQGSENNEGHYTDYRFHMVSSYKSVVRFYRPEGQDRLRRIEGWGIMKNPVDDHNVDWK